ncbi:MAG: 3-phosphoshikimate 1-carboxyvinyltransferase [Nonlabens sp.]
MDLKLSRPLAAHSGGRLEITGSKSESNRLLILQALFPKLKLSNLSISDDTVHLKDLLQQTSNKGIDIGHAGTAMRFGTAFLAATLGVETVISGSERMHQRPIGILVDALRELGASINYEGREGFPPLRIKGANLPGGSIIIDGSVSSQFLTALLLIAPSMKDGLLLRIKKKLASRPYLDMTLELLRKIGVEVHAQNAMDKQAGLVIEVKPLLKLNRSCITVESDWSSAGYWYSWVALQHTGYTVQLTSYTPNSLQGDSKLQDIYKPLGVESIFENRLLKLVKVQETLPDMVMLDLSKEPDQAQTLFATCLGLGINAHLTGLQTLKIKETDRIEAMKVVGSRFRESVIKTTHDSIILHIDGDSTFNKRVVVDTYHDHRMAMAFAPLTMFTNVIIKDAGVVSKSYPSYWKHMEALGCRIDPV